MEGKRILMIEDDAYFLEVMQYFLEMEKCQFTGLTQADDIIPIVQSTKPDLVLLDYVLPTTNGGELCRKLYECPDSEHIPVLLISAYPEKLLELDHVPFSIFIPKPFDLWDMVACMEDLFRLRVGTAA